MTPTEHEFVDQMGLIFEASGTTRMMGRVFGFLLICDPPTQALPDLCEALGTSKGAISIVTRQLVAAGLIERVHVRGVRTISYRVRTGGWMDLMNERMRGPHSMLRLAERGLQALAGQPPERTARLEEFRDFYAYIEREMALLFERYRAARYAAKEE